MSFLWFKDKPQTLTHGVIDISGSSVGFALVSQKQVGKNTCPSIDLSFRPKTTKADPDHARQLAIVESELVRHLEKAHQSGQLPDDYHFFLPSTSYIAQTRVITYAPTKPFAVTLDLLNSITTKEAETFRRTLGDPDANRVIENRIMSVKINGYEVPEPLGKEAKSLTIVQYLAVAPLEDLLRLRSSVMRATHRDRIRFHSSFFAVFSVLRDLVGDRSFTLVDVSGEITDVGVVSQGAVNEVASFPLGKNTLLRKLARTSGIEGAHSALKLHSEGQPVDTPKVITDYENEWVEAFAQTITQLSGRNLIPEHCFVLSDDQTSNLFADWLKQSEVGRQALSAGKHLDVTAIDHKLFNGFCEGDAIELKDHVLMAEALFCDKMDKLEK